MVFFCYVAHLHQKWQHFEQLDEESGFKNKYLILDYENCVDLLKVVCSHIRDPKITNAIILAYY